MMKRRNVDCVKPRRPLKRNKISEGIYGSTVVYVKFVVVWLLVLAADYLLDFRFEYLWPFWLLLRSVYDSFRYQGLAFCVLFLCMAVTADMVAIVFIPASWLFFAASTYVWVQFVWHTERGVCLPTVVLWAVFIYIEALVRLKEVKNVPFHMDLCRPFAAHCIGYPVVTLGFGLKSYVGYRLRQRKQREVARENEFYVQLLQEALPADMQHIKNMNTAAAQAAAAAVVKEYEDTEAGEVEANGPTSTASTGGSNRGGLNHSASSRSSSNSAASAAGAWTATKDYSLLPSIPFLSRLRKGSSAATIASSGGAAAGGSQQPPHQTRTPTSWWRSWLSSKPDNIYNNGSSHTLNSCLVNNSVSSSSSTSSSSSSCSSTSSGSSSSSSSSSCSTRGRSAKSVEPVLEPAGGGSGAGLLLTTSNGAAMQQQQQQQGTTSTTAITVAPTSSSSSSKHNKVSNNALHAELEYMQKKGVSARSVNNFDESAADRDKTAKGGSSSHSTSNTTAGVTTTAQPETEKHKNKSNASMAAQSNGSAKLSLPHHTNNLRSDSAGGGGAGNKKNKNKDNNRDATSPARDHAVTIIKLESELKRARSDLSSSRSLEQELRNQINSLMSSQKLCQQEMTQLQQDNDTLQNKLHGLVTARQSDRVALGGLERRVAEERRNRQSAEAQLQQVDRRARKLEEQQLQQQQRQQQQQQSKSSGSSSGECSEACRSRRAELEAESKRLRREHRSLEEKARAFERENVTLRQYKESQNDSEVLMSALSAMQDRNSQLETTLSAETRVKLDLFSALGEAKRQLVIDQSLIDRKDKEIDELKTKITEVLAVCPATSFSSTALHSSTQQPPYQYSSKLLMPQVSNSMDPQLPPHMVSDLNLDSLVVGLGFPQSSISSPPPLSSPGSQLSSLSSPVQQQQQPPISPPTPGPISPPSGMATPHSSLDPNARIYTPKGVNGGPNGCQQDN